MQSVQSRSFLVSPAQEGVDGSHEGKWTHDRFGDGLIERIGSSIPARAKDAREYTVSKPTEINAAERTSSLSVCLRKRSASVRPIPPRQQWTRSSLRVRGSPDSSRVLFPCPCGWRRVRGALGAIRLARLRRGRPAVRGPLRRRRRSRTRDSWRPLSLCVHVVSMPALVGVVGGVVCEVELPSASNRSRGPRAPAAKVRCIGDRAVAGA